MDADLTLEQAITAARQSEAVEKQQAVVRGAESQATNVDNIQSHQQQRKHRGEGAQQQRRPFPVQQGQKQVSAQKICSRCGKSPSHGCPQCPAREATCRKCGKKGHYQVVCRSAQSIRLIAADQEEVFIASIDEQVPMVDAGENPWVVTISINGSPVEFKIDTGADVSVISDTTYKALAKKTPLKPATKSLTGHSSQPLDVRSHFTGTLQHGSCTFSEDIFVAIESLRLVSRVNTVADQRLPYMHPDLFGPLGKIPGKYHIQVKDDAQLFALSTPRRVTLPLQPKVKSELQRMEQLGVISKVNEPTDWCAGMVVVPKQDGKVRICVDLT